MLELPNRATVLLPCKDTDVHLLVALIACESLGWATEGLVTEGAESRIWNGQEDCMCHLHSSENESCGDRRLGPVGKERWTLDWPMGDTKYDLCVPRFWGSLVGQFVVSEVSQSICSSAYSFWTVAASWIIRRELWPDGGTTCFFFWVWIQNRANHCATVSPSSVSSG